MALERNASLFVSDPTSVAGLEQNELMINFGYSYYAGAPWTVGRNRGRYTVTIFTVQDAESSIASENCVLGVGLHWYGRQ